MGRECSFFPMLAIAKMFIFHYTYECNYDFYYEDIYYYYTYEGITWIVESGPVWS